LAFFPAVLSAANLATDPILVLDTGGHSDLINSVLFSHSGKYFLSAGDDKVVRVWDTKTGHLLRSIRGQIGDGFEGKIYAMALSTDDRFLALGGWMAGDPVESRSIRLHDFATGEVIGLLRGHKDVVEGLAFSPDGRQLASASADYTVQLWDVAQRRSTKTFADHKGRVHAVAFSPDGTRVASAGLDSNVCLWDVPGHRKIVCHAEHQKPVASVVFSPDGRFLASSGLDDTVRLWDGRTGNPLRVLAKAESQANLTFAPDSNRLLITNRSARRYLCQVISVSNGGVVAEFAGHDDIIHATAISPDGRLAATAGGSQNQIYVWELGSGREVRKITGVGQPVRSVGFGIDGNSIAFGTSSYDTPKANEYGPLEQIVRLNMKGKAEISLDGTPREANYRRSLDHYQSDSLVTPRKSPDQDPVTLQVVRDGHVRHEFPRDKTSGYRHTCYTFTPDGRYIVSGGIGGVLSVYSMDNWKERRLIGHTGEVWSVAVSSDGRTLMSGSDDQTIRLWDIATGNNLLTIFAGSDLEWVAWTPEGYYTSSVSGDRYVGWHLNRGIDRAASYFSVAQFRKEFYKPEVVYERLRTHEARQALVSAPDVRRIVPPSIRFIGTGDGPIVATQATYHVKLEVVSDTLPITKISLFVNGAPLEIGQTRGDPMKREVETDALLSSGANTITAIASNASADSRASSQTVDLPRNIPSSQGELYALVVGVSEYQDKSWRLSFPAQDAEAVAKALKAQEGKRFSHVHVSPLTNQKATRQAIEDGLRQTVKMASSIDTVLVFLAGHGYIDSKRYYFATAQHVEGHPDNDVEWTRFLDILTDSKSKAVLLVDTCYAAAISDRINFTQLMQNEFFTKGTGLFTFAASKETETAEEKDEWGHGAFTKGLLESLAAKYDDKEIYSDDLAVRIRRAVAKLTKMQHPVHFALPLGMDPVALFSSVQ
jgi:WD40 repeat protein